MKRRTAQKHVFADTVECSRHKKNRTNESDQNCTKYVAKQQCWYSAK